MDFGERLSKAMGFRGMRQKELAKATGMTEATISRYVNSIRRPDIDFLRDVIRILEVSSDYLLGFSDQIVSPYAEAMAKANDEAVKYCVICCASHEAAAAGKDQEEMLDRLFVKK